MLRDQGCLAAGMSNTNLLLIVCKSCMTLRTLNYVKDPKLYGNYGLLLSMGNAHPKPETLNPKPLNPKP